MKNKQEQINKFLTDNKEAFRVLAKKIRTLDTCKGYKGEEERRARELAIRMVVEWLNELWVEVTAEEIDNIEEEEKIFKILEKEEV